MVAEDHVLVGGGRVLCQRTMRLALSTVPYAREAPGAIRSAS